MFRDQRGSNCSRRSVLKATAKAATGGAALIAAAGGTGLATSSVYWAPEGASISDHNCTVIDNVPHSGLCGVVDTSRTIECGGLTLVWIDWYAGYPDGYVRADILQPC